MGGVPLFACAGGIRRPAAGIPDGRAAVPAGNGGGEGGRPAVPAGNGGGKGRRPAVPAGNGGGKGRRTAVPADGCAGGRLCRRTAVRRTVTRETAAFYTVVHK